MPLLDPTFVVTSNPAANTIATATHAAATGKQHVCQTIHCTLNAGGSGEISVGLPTLNTAFVDSAAVSVPVGQKLIYLVVSSNLTWVSSGQATWQPFVGRTTFAATGGASSQVDVNHILVGSAQNLGGAAATSLVAGVYRLSPSAVTELQWADPFTGIELHFPSALNGGAATMFVESFGPVSSQVSVVLRDGVSGVGAVLWSSQMALQGLAGMASPVVEQSGLAVQGTTGNAMTLEFIAAGGTTTFETVSLTGFLT